MPLNAPNRAVDRVFIHCSASDRPEHDDIAVMDRWHKNRGWLGVGYHFFIRKDGMVQSGRDLEHTPAAQAGHNTGSIAICLHGLVPQAFTRMQRKSLIALCGEIHRAYGGMVTFHGHGEVANKDCPVINVREVLGLDTDGSMTFATYGCAGDGGRAPAAAWRCASAAGDGARRGGAADAGPVARRRASAGGGRHLRTGDAGGGDRLPAGEGPGGRWNRRAADMGGPARAGGAAGCRTGVRTARRSRKTARESALPRRLRVQRKLKAGRP